MSLRIAIIIDPLESLVPEKDSTLALMHSAIQREYSIFYGQIDDLAIQDGVAGAYLREVRPVPHGVMGNGWDAIGSKRWMPLTAVDLTLMRKDPPVDKRFIHACYILEEAKRQGAIVRNDPEALLQKNEKLFPRLFPELTPPSFIGCAYQGFYDFLHLHEKIILKPLDEMGGAGVLLIERGDINFETLWELQTKKGTYPAIAQRFIPEIIDGDVRVMMLNGRAFPHVLVRLPKQGSIRGNLAAGGLAKVRTISATEQAIADRVGPVLLEYGVAFAGLDIIGPYLTEINITSPTGIPQIAKATGIDLADLTLQAFIARDNQSCAV